MKKFLALVLALVMTMSLVTISAGAEDFTDDSKITYEEAVDVMTAVGVVGGYADGSFNPTAGLTRGAAAKIICNMILGPTTAEALVANEAPFSDVAADNVFAGYIAYCVNEGIISGYADGTFKPAAPLTGYAFMKMLLGALGYDAAIEGYVGTNWSIAVAKRALNIGLDDGLVGDFAGAKALTREEAALYAFNTLKATCVEYKNKSTISVGDITVSTSAEATKVANGSGSDFAGKTDTTTMEFAELYFSKLMLASSVDAYKSAANKWTYKGKTVGTYNGDATIVYTANMDTAAGKAQIEADLEGYNNFEAGTAVPSYWNGKAYATYISDLTVDAIAAITGNGKVVEIYVSDNGVSKIVVIEGVVGKVTAVSDKAETITIQAQVAGTGFGVGAETWTTDKGYGEFEKDDIVLVTAYNTTSYTSTGSTLTAVQALEEVEGLATKKNTAKATITIDGTAYSSAKCIAAAKNVANFAVSNEYDATLYLDQYGYVVYAEPGVASTNDKAIGVLKFYNGLNEEGQIVPMVKGILSSGEIVNWETTADYSSNTTWVNSVMTYAKQTDGTYVIATSNRTASDSANMADGSTSQSTSPVAEVKTSAKTYVTGNGQKLYFDDAVKFIYINNGKAVVKEGVQKLATTANIHFTVEVVDTVPYITSVFVKAAASNSTVSVNDLVLVLAGDTGDYKTFDENGDAVTFDTMDAYIAGEKVDNFFTGDIASASSNGFFTVEVDNDTEDYILVNNAYTTGDNGALSVSAEETYTALVGDLLSGSNDYDIAGATFVDTTDYGYESFAQIKADLADTGSDIYGDTVTFMVVYDYDTGVASYVYVTSIA